MYFSLLTEPEAPESERSMQPRPRGSEYGVIIGVCSAVGSLLVIACIVMYMFYRRHRNQGKNYRPIKRVIVMKPVSNLRSAEFNLSKGLSYTHQCIPF